MNNRAERVPASGSSFVQRIGDFVDRIDYVRMESSEQLEEVYRLRYDAYRREDFIEANAERRCLDPFDETDNHLIYGLYLEGKLISSIRIHVLDKMRRESPSTLIYGDTLNPLLDQNKIMIDPTRFTADLEASKKYKALPYATLRIASMASVYFDADYCLSCIRPEHAAFYKKVYRSTQIGDIRYFPKVKFGVVLYKADAKNIRQDVWQRYPFFRAKRGEDDYLFGPQKLQRRTAETYLESVAEP
ncbi:MAG: N-acyl amino acid synthase FeeM domain-containing protein [Granulosicoccaceae bacterium]